MDIEKEREAFEAWLKSLNENGRTTYFLGQESTVAWEAWQAAKAQAVPEWLRKNQEKVKVYELHVKTLKQIHENEFNEKSESSYILGNLDGFFECLESDLGEIK